MGKTTDCKHGTDTFEHNCYECLDEENRELESENEQLKAELSGANCILHRERKRAEKAEAKVASQQKVIDAAIGYVENRKASF